MVRIIRVRKNGKVHCIRLQTLPFEDVQQFRNLRDEHRAHYALTRRSDQIVALPLTLGAPPIGEEKVVSVVENASLIRPLLEQRLVTVNVLTHELDRVHRAKAKHEKGTCIMGGILEQIAEKKDHPAREALIWNNLFFGPSRRKRVKMRPDWEAGNSPFFMHPEIIDEVIKYVYIPKDIAEGVRQLAKQKAAEKVKAEQDARKAAMPTAKQSGKTD
ncbi:hypothetical protein [Burkholderia gladioli]|uniref:hypothetical protein n=1 Tax=Burkholderia gladioli TaxID=28095 RepID=UPI00163E3634|nr:hypothetical protein [Burkholderia gladioli]MBU9174052.1 hypothetical protein [Burkholderia gladioli]